MSIGRRLLIFTIRVKERLGLIPPLDKRIQRVNSLIHTAEIGIRSGNLSLVGIALEDALRALKGQSLHHHW